MPRHAGAAQGRGEESTLPQELSRRHQSVLEFSPERPAFELLRCGAQDNTFVLGFGPLVCICVC